tara:strand:+ start:66770 stop:67084 length:315 start_codon:yes stop_codon:yes gene_type:complete
MTRFLIIVREYASENVDFIYTNGGIPLSIDAEQPIIIAMYLFNLKSKKKLLKGVKKNPFWDVVDWDLCNIDFSRLDFALELEYDDYDMLLTYTDLKTDPAPAKK